MARRWWRDFSSKKNTNNGELLAVRLPPLEGEFKTTEEFNTLFLAWAASFKEEIQEYLDVPPAHVVATREPKQLDQEVREWIKRVNIVSNTMMQDTQSPEIYQAYFRRYGMQYLRVEVDKYIESLEKNPAFVEGYGSAREVLARRYDAVRNPTYSDIAGTGVSWDVLKGRKPPGPNEFVATRPEDLKSYNYFAKIDSWKNPEPQIGEVLVEVFGNEARSIRIAVSPEANTFRGWNIDGIPVLNEKNIAVTAGGDPEKTAADSRTIAMNEIGHTAMYQLLGKDVFLPDFTWFNRFEGLSGLPTPSAHQFNEFGSDVASVAYGARVESDGGLRALARLIATHDPNRYGFSRAVVRKALEKTLSPESIDALSQISNEAQRTEELRKLTEGMDVVKTYLDFAKPLLREMIAYADGEELQKYTPPAP